MIICNSAISLWGSDFALVTQHTTINAQITGPWSCQYTHIIPLKVKCKTGTFQEPLK